MCVVRDGGARRALQRADRGLRHPGGRHGRSGQGLRQRPEVGGQRSDTIKILHVDPATGTATLAVDPARHLRHAVGPAGRARGLATDNKINAAFNNGPDPLIQTIENTFGIPIAHFVIIDFTGVINLVKSVGGINLDFPYPVRDNDDGNNNAGLNITHCRLSDPERQHGPGPGPLALLPVRGPTRVLGV